MCLERMVSYKEILNTTQRSILLGNGFSCSYNQRFNYNSIFDEMKSRASKKSIIEILGDSKTHNIESIMKNLTDSGQKDDAEDIRDLFIKTLVDIHPENILKVKKEKIDNCIYNMNEFTNVFTCNYDLLLYWVLVSEKNYNLSDGFIGKDVYYWRESYPNKVHFIHGALHLVNNEDNEFLKHSYSAKKGPLLYQVKQNLNDNSFPLIVSEGTSYEKMRQIDNNRYLKHSYDALSKIEGTLFIYGFSMAENDNHIKDQIIKSNIESLVVGIYGDKDLDSNIKLMAEINDIKSRNKHIKNVVYFDASPVNMWSKCYKYD